MKRIALIALTYLFQYVAFARMIFRPLGVYEIMDSLASLSSPTITT